MAVRLRFVAAPIDCKRCAKFCANYHKCDLDDCFIIHFDIEKSLFLLFLIRHTVIIVCEFQELC